MRPLALLAAAGLALALAAPPARADAVTDWNAAAAAMAMQEAKTPGPPDAVVPAKVALAIYEAADAVDRRFESYLGLPAAPGPASGEAAVAQAAFEVLANAYPSRRGDLERALAHQLAQVPDAARRDTGAAAGRAAAVAVLGRADREPGEVSPYRPAAAPGVYVPTDLPALPFEQVRARTWFIESPRAVMPAPPPALGGARYVRDYEEVRRLGGAESAERSPAQTAAAMLWSRSDIGPALAALADAPDRSLVQNARIYALAYMAMADASAAVTAAKLEYGFWRPITAIRNGAADRAEGTRPEPGWIPLLRTPMHPEYPCGHCIVAAAAGELIAQEFGPDAQLAFRDAALPAVSRRLTPQAYVCEVSFSRVLAGAHFRFSGEVAQTMGRAIARAAWTERMRPLAGQARRFTPLAGCPQ